MLNDKHIQAAHDLLRNQFPQFTTRASPLGNIHVHWRGASSSMTAKLEVSSHWVWRTSLHRYTVTWQMLVITRAATQQQSGGTDCSLFSIVFAYYAARGDDVTKLSFDPEGQLRSHVFTCFERKMLAPFPTNMAERVGRCREKQLNIETLLLL